MCVPRCAHLASPSVTITTFLVLVLLTPVRAIAFQGNTHSIDLERDSKQFLFATDVAQTGLDLGQSGADFTIEAWIRLESVSDGQTFVSKWDGDEAQQSFRFRINNANEMELTTSNNGTDHKPLAPGFFVSARGSSPEI